MYTKFILLFLQISLLYGKIHPKKLVCVVGAGRAGLISIRHLAQFSNEFEPIVFEKRSDVGGIWIYSNNLNSGVIYPMYNNLRANEPKEVMTCPDYHEFDGRSGHCPSHESVLDYMKNYTNHFNLRQYIQFNTVVEKITPILIGNDWRSTKWLMDIRKLRTNSSEKITCDAVIIGSGRFSTPKSPVIPGIERFSGRSLHSSAYRKPEDFTNQTVILLGAATSGIDIAVDLSNHVKKIFLSHRHEQIQYKLPANVIQVAGVIAVNDDDEFILQDGTKIAADSIIFCTGYHTDFSFLDASVGARMVNGNVYPLYQSTVNIEHPSMAFVGFDGRSLAFGLPVYSEANYFISLLRGGVKLPSRDEMLKIANSIVSTKYDKFFALETMHKWKMWKEMAEEGQFKPIPEFYEKAQSVWNKHRINDMVYFKDYKLIPTDDGNYTIQKI